MKKLGSWEKDGKGLPVFSYIGNLPFQEVDKAGKPVKLPQDPWFILGNYQLTLFTHVSGEYELIAGQRSWGRVNAGDMPDSGKNRAVIRIDGEEWELCGIHSAAADARLCERKFGCGYAAYRYCLGDVEVKRTLAVKPSLTIDGGKSAFLTTIEIRNHGNQGKNIEYLEGITANYVEVQCQNTNEKKMEIRYIPETDEETACAKVRMQGITEDPLLCTEPYMRSCVDGFPPTLYMKAVTPELRVGVNGREIIAAKKCRLAPGEKETISLITGYLYEYTGETVQMAVEEFCGGSADEAAFSEEWKTILPDLSEEEDTECRQEMRWHAYVLEAMATYSHYYKETKIPQGTIYDYNWGQHASARDNFQHALPLVYYNQKFHTQWKVSDLSRGGLWRRRQKIWACKC